MVEVRACAFVRCQQCVILHITKGQRDEGTKCSEWA
nr:MAG TPA: hypothetical protein [Caudoviricetes sp.]